MTKPFSVKERLHSFRFAFAGLKPLIVEQHNARVHLLCTLLVVVFGVCLKVSPIQWAVLVLAVALVWAAEALNSSLEYLADATVPEENELIGKAKDVAAAGVLVAATAAALIAAIIFLPLIMAKFLG